MTRTAHHRPLRALAAALTLALPTLPALATPPASVSATAEPATLAEWQSAVERAIDRSLRAPAGLRDGELLTARIGVSFDADGRATAHRLVGSSGLAAADQEAERLATQMTVPRLPQALRGQQRTVEMQVVFGTPASRMAVHDAVSSSRERTSAMAERIDGTVRETRIAQNSPG